MPAIAWVKAHRESSGRPAALLLMLALFSTAGFGQRKKIAGMTVQPYQEVLAPGDTESINLYGGLQSLTDEHVTIFPPGTLSPGYLFFVASKTELQTTLQDQYTGQTDQGESGLVALTSTGPNTQGIWTLDYAAKYGIYAQGKGQQRGDRNAQVFLSAMEHLMCPTLPDQTFDLNYAVGGSVLIDPTVGPNNNGLYQDGMLYIYEGTNRCIDLTGVAGSSYFYSTIGIATSGDNGLIWPMYASIPPLYTPPSLPLQDASQGPNLVNGAMGAGVCHGNHCNTTPPSTYGRYAALDTTVTIPMVENAPLMANIGNSEPSAFIDNVHSGVKMPYLYIVNSYGPGTPGLGSGPYVNPAEFGRLEIARAQLNGGTAPLSFLKWFGTAVRYPTTSGSFDLTFVATGYQCGIWPCFLSNSGLGTNGPQQDGGGLGSPLFPTMSNPTQIPLYYTTCQSSDQDQLSGEVSYVPKTSQYLMLFVCRFPKNIGPDGSASTSDPYGAAVWFFSTLDATLYDLSNQDKWTPPQIILSSWQAFSNSSPCSYFGWYPSSMAPGKQPGQLGLTGYIFSMNGCLDGPAGQPREFVSSAFEISTL